MLWSMSFRLRSNGPAWATLIRSTQDARGKGQSRCCAGRTALPPFQRVLRPASASSFISAIGSRQAFASRRNSRAPITITRRAPQPPLASAVPVAVTPGSYVRSLALRIT